MARIWESFTNQEQWRIYLVDLVQKNDKALYRSILVIYELQTDGEKLDKVTKEHNNLGFGSVDAEFMSSLAEQIRKGGRLSEKQLAIARNKMRKYWRQLMLVTKGEITVDYKKGVKQ